MFAHQGDNFLLKIAIKDRYLTVGGMRSTKFILNNQLIDTTNKSSMGWRGLLSKAGTSSVTIHANGVFTNTESEQKIRKIAFDNVIEKFQICFGNGDKLEGAFLIASYERIGNSSEEENYAIILESSGIIEYTIVK